MTSRMAAALFLLSIYLLPFSYAIKKQIGISDEFRWIDPTLLLSMVTAICCYKSIGMLVKRSRQFSVAVLLSLFFWLSAVVNLLGRPADSLYVALREPMRILLAVTFLACCLLFLRHERVRSAALRIFGLLTIFELLYGIYLLLIPIFSWIPAPTVLKSYAVDYLLRQTMSLGGVFRLPRMAGTFDEAPIFGLFMFGMFLVFHVCRREIPRARYRIYASAAFAGAMLSASTQIVGAFCGWLAVGLVARYLSVLRDFIAHRRSRRLAIVSLAFLTIVAVPAGTVAYCAIASKLDNYSSSRAVYGASVGERAWHAHVAFSLLGKSLETVALGVGPGRYGEFAAKLNSQFKENVTVQILPVDVLIACGVCGFALLLLWLLIVGVNTHAAHGAEGIAALIALLIADCFQANWVWEIVFIAIAFFSRRGRRYFGCRVGSDFGRRAA